MAQLWNSSAKHREQLWVSEICSAKRGVGSSPCHWFPSLKVIGDVNSGIHSFMEGSPKVQSKPQSDPKRQSWGNMEENQGREITAKIYKERPALTRL